MVGLAVLTTLVVLGYLGKSVMVSGQKSPTFMDPELSEGGTEYRNDSVYVKGETSWMNSTINVTEAGPTEWEIIQQEASTMTLYKAGLGIHTYWLPILIPFGLVGNTLSFLVMMRPHNRRISCCVYMAALAIADNGMLIDNAYYWYVTDLARRPWKTLECYIWSYLFHVFSLNGVVLIVFITIDRFIAVRFPLMCSTWCTPKRARLTAMLITPATFLVELPHYFFVRIVDGKTCAGFSAKSPYSLVLSWVYMLINSFVPFIILIILNMLIISAVRKSTKFSSGAEKGSGSQTSMGGKKGDDGGDQKAARDKQLLVMLMLVSFALLILLLPIYIRYIAFLFIDRKQSSYMLALYVLLYNFTNKLAITNNGVNFVLYCIGGSKFRQDLREILCGCCIDEGADTSSTSRTDNTSA